MFKIQPKSATFKSGVAFHEYDEQGRRVRHVIDMEFKRLTQKQYQAAIDAYQFPKDEDGNPIKLDPEESLDIQARQVAELIAGWKIAGPDDQPFAFSHDNIKLMLDSYPGLMLAIVQTAGAGFTGEARKN